MTYMHIFFSLSRENVPTSTILSAEYSQAIDQVQPGQLLAEYIECRIYLLLYPVRPKRGREVNAAVTTAPTTNGIGSISSTNSLNTLLLSFDIAVLR